MASARLTHLHPSARVGRPEVREARSEVLLKPTVEQPHACLQQTVRAFVDHLVAGPARASSTADP
jgi:hypothetical protein